MDDDGEGIDEIAIQKDIELHGIGLLVAGELVVEGGIALGGGFQLIEEVENDLREWDGIGKVDTCLIEVGHRLEDAATILHKLHDIPYHIGGDEDLYLGDRFFDMLDLGHRRELRRIVHRYHRAVGLVDVINDRRRGGDELQVVLTLEAFLHDVHVKQSQKAAAETEAQCLRGFRHVLERRIIQLQLFKSHFQVVIVLALDRVETAENHRECLAVARQCFAGAALFGRDGIPYLAVGDILDAGCHVADRAAGEDVAGLREGREIADFRHGVDLAGGHHADIHPRTDLPILHTDIGDRTLVGVENGVENEAAKRRFRMVFRRRHLLDDTLQDFFDILPGLGGDGDRLRHVKADDILDFRLYALHVCAREVDFVDDRDDLQIMVERKIYIGKRLRLYALRRIDDEDRAFAGRKGTRDFIVEIDMPWGIDEVQLVGFAVLIRVVQAHRLFLDGDAALTLELHRV